MFVAYAEKCWKITKDKVTEAKHLFTNQEEADTRMFLHVKDVETQGYDGIVLISEDTDVFVLGVYVAHSLPNIAIYQKRGTQSRSRLINISEISSSIGPVASQCLSGLHAIMGCDTVSAFSGKGKVKALKLVLQNESYQEIFSELGLTEAARHNITFLFCFF